MNTIIDFTLKLFQLVPMIEKGIAGAKEAFEWGRTAVEAMVAEGRDPSDEERAELDSRIAGLRSALHSDEI